MSDKPRIGAGGFLTRIKNVIGYFGDYVAVPFVSGVTTLMGFLQTGYYHIHGASFLYPDKADPVLLTSSAAAWSETGALAEIIPANTITHAFDLHWASVSDISANLYGVIDIFAGPIESPVKIGSVDVTRTDNFSQEGNKPVQIPEYQLVFQTQLHRRGHAE